MFFGLVALLDPPAELPLLPLVAPVVPVDPPVIPVWPLAWGLSTATPVLEVPGCVTPVPVEFGCGAFIFAPCANAPVETAARAQAAAKVAIFFILYLPVNIKRISNRALGEAFRPAAKTLLENASWIETEQARSAKPIGKFELDRLERSSLPNGARW